MHKRAENACAKRCVVHDTACMPWRCDGAISCQVRAVLLHLHLALVRTRALLHRTPMWRLREAFRTREDDRNASSWIQVMDP